MNDAPVLTVPGAKTVDEDTLLSITGISVADVDAVHRRGEDHDVGRQRSIDPGAITGLTFTVGDGTSDAAMTFTGTLANVNAALARVDYLGNANFAGADTLAISVDDQGNTGSGGAKTHSGTVAITVAAVNDAPVLTVPGAQTVNEDTLLSITGISVADVDAATGAVKITMSVAQRSDYSGADHGPDVHRWRWHERCVHDIHRYVSECEFGAGSRRLLGQCQLQRSRCAGDQCGRSGQHRLGWCEDRYASRWRSRWRP